MPSLRNHFFFSPSLRDNKSWLSMTGDLKLKVFRLLSSLIISPKRDADQEGDYRQS